MTNVARPRRPRDYPQGALQGPNGSACVRHVALLDTDATSQGAALEDVSRHYSVVPVLVGGRGCTVLLRKLSRPPLPGNDHRAVPSSQIVQSTLGRAFATAGVAPVGFAEWQSSPCRISRRLCGWRLSI